MGMESLIFLPVRVGDRTVGLVTVISKKKSAFNEEMIDLLTFVVERLGVVVENSLLHDESEKSHLEMQLLAEELAASNERVVEANQRLEERVQVRTQELEAATERAMRSEKLAIIGQLSGGIAHDLRNPLGTISNAAYLARRKFAAGWSSENNQKITEILELIDSQVVRANNVISNLLSYGSGREIFLSQVQIGDIFNDLMSSFVLRDDIDFSMATEPDLPPILGDSSYLIRALQNLVSNAQEAMETGGQALYIHQGNERCG
jgi:signal transduction histidine kinase